jgi:hypothetical protein
MLTPSIIALMISNAIAASGAVFAAWQANRRPSAALTTGTDVATDAGSVLRGKIFDAA